MKQTKMQPTRTQRKKMQQKENMQPRGASIGALKMIQTFASFFNFLCLYVHLL